MEIQGLLQAYWQLLPLADSLRQRLTQSQIRSVRQWAVTACKSQVRDCPTHNNLSASGSVEPIVGWVPLGVSVGLYGRLAVWPVWQAKLVTVNTLKSR